MTGLADLASVIERAQRRDPEAFGVLIDEYSNRLYGFLYRLTGSREDAEDMVQEVFVRVVRTIARYEHRGHFEPWLFRIATNLARDRGRRTTRTPETTLLEANGTASDGDAGGPSRLGNPRGPTPESGLERADDIDLLQLALARLPQAEREVLMLRHYGQLSFARIAEMMSTPLGTALARAHRGLGKLRQWMESGQ